MKDFILYNYFRSSASQRVRIALHLKGVDFEYRAVHLLNNGGEQHKPEYAALNPSKQVPTLIHKGKAIGQSIAIIDYLDTVIEKPRLFPKDPYARSLVLQACEIVNSGIQPLMNTGILKHLGEKLGVGEEAKKEWIQHWNLVGLRALESFLKPHAGKYSFGDEVSAADIYVTSQMTGAKRFETPLEEFETLRRVFENCDQIEAFKKGGPMVQPDTPLEMRQ